MTTTTPNSASTSTIYTSFCRSILMLWWLHLWLLHLWLLHLRLLQLRLLNLRLLYLCLLHLFISSLTTTTTTTLLHYTSFLLPTKIGTTTPLLLRIVIWLSRAHRTAIIIPVLARPNCLHQVSLIALIVLIIMVRLGRRIVHIISCALTFILVWRLRIKFHLLLLLRLLLLRGLLQLSILHTNNWLLWINHLRLLPVVLVESTTASLSIVSSERFATVNCVSSRKLSRLLLRDCLV